MTTGELTGTATEQTAWVPLADSFGARLALVRQHMGWGNVKRAAEECGLPVQSWRTWERDGVMPNRLTTIAMTIASKTGCDYLWLVHGPDRGSLRPPTPTTRYAPVARVLARVGDDSTRKRETATNIHRGLATRPVSQTRPLRQHSRPLTPLSV